MGITIKSAFGEYFLSYLCFFIEIAELVGGEDLEDTVLAVPLDYSDEQILALR